jgi:hypothetical protein
VAAAPLRRTSPGRLDPESVENYRKIADELDAQRRNILPEILQLQQDLESARSMLEVMTEFLNTPGVMEELLRTEIQQSPLIKNLVEIAGKSPDVEGWTALGEATGQLQDFPSEDILKHCAQFGQKSLSASDGRAKKDTFPAWPHPIPAHFEPCFSGQKLAMSPFANGCANSRWPIRKPSVPTSWWCSGSGRWANRPLP